MRSLRSCSRSSFSLSIRVLFTATLCFAFALPVGAASADDSLPKYQVLRQNEDWSVLRDYDGPDDFFNPAKYIPLNDEGDIYLSFGGQLRERVEFWDGFNFGNTGTADDDDHRGGGSGRRNKFVCLSQRC